MTQTLSPTQPDTPEAALQSFNVLAEWADMVIDNISERTPYVELISKARDAHDLEKAAFRVRGACGRELKRRAKERGAQIGPEISAMAKEIGVAPSTLEDDIRIFETFGDALRHDAILDREHYRLALPAPDPLAAIELAHSKKATDASYSTRDFREDVTKLQGGTEPAKVERGKFFHIFGDEDTQEAWVELREHRDFTKKDDATLFKQIVFEARDYHKGRR